MAEILDQHGNPYRSTTQGRHFKRSGSSHSGTNATWKPAIITKMQAEREKALTSTRSWDLYHNTAIGRGVISGAKVDTIGTGLTPLPTISPQQLGITGEAARELKQAQIDAFMLWGFDPRRFCDGQARQNFYQLQGWGYLSWKLDGIGIFQVSFEDADDIRPLRLTLTPVDAGRLRTPKGKAAKTAATTGAQIYDGIEVDSRGKPIALHLSKSSLGLFSAPLDTERFPIWSDKTGLPEFLLISGVDNIAEYRQGSMMEPIMKLTRDTEELQDAALVGALTAQLFSIVMGKSATAPSNLGGDPTQTNDTTQGSYDWDKAVYELAAGTIIQAAPGMEAKSIDTGKPGANFNDHMEQLLQHVGTSTGRGKENLTRTYQSSFSASMANILNAERYSDDDRVVMDSNFNQPAWSWICWELAVTGQTPLPVGIDPVRDLYLYSAATFLPPPPKVLQPKNAAEANQTMLKTGETTLSEVFAKNNKDPEKSFQQLAADRKKLLDLQEEHGVDLGVRPYDKNDPDANNGGTANVA